MKQPLKVTLTVSPFGTFTTNLLSVHSSVLILTPVSVLFSTMHHLTLEALLLTASKLMLKVALPSLAFTVDSKVTQLFKPFCI